MQDILNSSQAARVIGCGPQMVRERIKRGIWTFGTVVTAKEAGNTQNSYEINKYQLAAHLGIPPEEVDRRLKGGQAHESQRLDSGRTDDERTADGYVSSLAGHGILDMKKRKWTMKRIVDTLFVLVILGDIATMIMFVMISIKILKMQEVITWLIQQ